MIWLRPFLAYTGGRWPLLLVLAAAGCRSAIPEVDPAAAPFREALPGELERLRRGRSAYIARCSGCHALHPPGRGTAGEWRGWMAAMAERSKLTGDERREIEAYLAATARPGTNL